MLLIALAPSGRRTRACIGGLRRYLLRVIADLDHLCAMLWTLLVRLLLRRRRTVIGATLMWLRPTVATLLLLLRRGGSAGRHCGVLRLHRHGVLRLRLLLPRLQVLQRLRCGVVAVSADGP